MQDAQTPGSVACVHVDGAADFLHDFQVWYIVPGPMKGDLTRIRVRDCRCYAARRSPLRDKAGEPVWASTGRIGRPDESTTPSATLYRLSESGRILQMLRRAGGPIVSSTRERSCGGPISRSGVVLTSA